MRRLCVFGRASRHNCWNHPVVLFRPPSSVRRVLVFSSIQNNFPPGVFPKFPSDADPGLLYDRDTVLADVERAGRNLRFVPPDSPLLEDFEILEAACGSYGQALRYAGKEIKTASYKVEY